MEQKIKVAVIGTGEIATKVRIPAYFSNKHVDLVGLVDLDLKRAERTAKKFGIDKFFRSIDELLAKQDVDAVSICTPPQTHADLILEAIGHDVHVLCEKPMANDLEKGRKVFDICKAENKILMVSSYRRFVSYFQKARELLLKGTLGHVWCIEDIQLSSSPLLTWGKSPWYYSTEGGGVLFDLGPHFIDILNYLYGDFPIAVSAHGSTYLDSPVEEYSVCTLEFPEGRAGVGIMSWLSSPTIETTSIYGTAATLQASPKLFLEINRIDIPEVSLWREITLRLINLKFGSFLSLGNAAEKNVDPMQRETDYFIEQIRQNRTFSDSSLNALNVLITIDSAKKSLREGRRIEISCLRQ